MNRSTIHDSRHLQLQSLNDDQRQAVLDLIKEERKMASRWWTCLNEMSWRGLLPEWVKKAGGGSSDDWDRWKALQKKTDKALSSIVARDITGSRGVEVALDRGESLLKGLERHNRMQLPEAVQQPKAVLAHRSGKATLDGTNVRAKS